jgi:hypothetical protein
MSGILQLLLAGGAALQSFIAVGGDGTGNTVNVYAWATASGFGSRYAGGAVTWTHGPTRGLSFNPTNAAIAWAASQSGAGFETFAAYRWSNAGFGTRYSNPANFPTFQNVFEGDPNVYIQPQSATGVAFTNANNAIATSHFETSPHVVAFGWTDASGFGSKFSDPGTGLTGPGNSVAFTASDNAIAVAHGTAPYVSAYPWSGSGFGTKFSNPGTQPTGTGRGVAFTAAGDAIAVAHATAPYVSVYPWSGSGFGTKFSDPGTALPSQCYSVAFTASGNVIALGHQTTPHVSAYSWSGSGFGTKFSDPATAGSGNQSSTVDFTPTDDAIALGQNISPFVHAYPWSGSGFGTKFSNPATLPTGSQGGQIAFSN